MRRTLGGEGGGEMWNNRFLVKGKTVRKETFRLMAAEVGVAVMKM